MATSKTVRNADGSTFSVRTVPGIMGTLLRVTHSVIPTAGGELLWDAPYGSRLYYLPGGGHMVPITNDKYRAASSKAQAQELALSFFAESYADSLRHAEEEGIPVRDCFRK